MNRKRNQEIDIMKGLLTLMMILCHCIQFFGYENKGVEKILVSFVNLTTFSGFLFCFGYVCSLAYYQGELKRAVLRMGRAVLRLWIAFAISGLGYVALVEHKIFRKDLILSILTLQNYPGWSEFLASFAAVMLVGIILFPLMKRMNFWMLLVIALAGALGCFLPYDKITNPWLALFVGSTNYTTFPVLQYGVYFAAGVWMANRKKRLDWKIFLWSAAYSLPCIWFFWKNGCLPGRFPPTALFIGGGALGVFLYALIAGGLRKTCGMSVLGKPAEGLSLIGRNSLYCLLMSNLLIFAVAGSKFSFRSNDYAYGFYLVLLAILFYFNRIKK